MKILKLYAYLILFIISCHAGNATLSITNAAHNLSKNLIAEVEKRVLYTHMNDVTDKIRIITKNLDDFLNEAKQISSTFGKYCGLTDKFTLFSDLLFMEYKIKDEVLMFDRYIISPFLRENKNLSRIDLMWVRLGNSIEYKLKERLEMLHETFTRVKQNNYISVLDSIINETQESCPEYSLQYVLYNTVYSIGYLDALGLGLQQYCYAFYKIISDAYPIVDVEITSFLFLGEKRVNGYKYLIEMKEEHEKFIPRNTQTIKIAKTYISLLRRSFWSDNRDSKKEYTPDKFKIKLRLFQNYIVNEIDLNHDKSCSNDCPYFSHGSQVQRCHDNRICAIQRTCEGKLWNCYEEREIRICPAGKDSNIRYEHINIKGERFYGGMATDYCYNNKVEAKTWLRWFYQCSNCMCICEASTPNTDRYISLRPAVSDAHLNYVVTDFGFTVKNHIIHIGIKQGKILPNGIIEINSDLYSSGYKVHWKDVDNYTINDKNVFEGWDYHTLNWQNRTMCLDELNSLNKSHVLTGLRFKSNSFDGQSYLTLQLRLTPYDYKTGQLSNEKSYWYSNDLPFNHRTKMNLDKPALHDYKHSTCFQFTTNLYQDAGQSVVPHLDNTGLNARVMAPLSGAGLFINIESTLKFYAFTFDVSPYL